MNLDIDRYIKDIEDYIAHIVGVDIMKTIYKTVSSKEYEKYDVSLLFSSAMDEIQDKIKSGDKHLTETIDRIYESILKNKLVKNIDNYCESAGIESAIHADEPYEECDFYNYPNRKPFTQVIIYYFYYIRNIAQFLDSCHLCL